MKLAIWTVFMVFRFFVYAFPTRSQGSQRTAGFGRVRLGRESAALLTRSLSGGTVLRANEIKGDGER